MTQTFGQHMQDVATRLISKYGDSAVTFTRVTPGSFDPTTGAVAAGSTLTYVAQGVSSQFLSEEVNNQTILYTDLKYLIEVSTQVPIVGDTVVLNDDFTYRIMSVVTDGVQDTYLCYTLQLRI